MKVYRSKIGAELIPISIILGIVGFLIIYESSWPGLIVFLLIAAFIGHMFATTYYQVEGQTLKINCGFFYHQKIEISSVRKIVETRNVLSAPAISINRLEIFTTNLIP